MCIGQYGNMEQNYLNFMVFTEKSKFSFYFIVHTSMRVSDVISNVTKQNMNVMALTLSA